MFIEQPPALYRLLFPGAVWRVVPKKAGEKRVYVTFDDGPDAEITGQVLDILDRYSVKATFFMVGDNVRRNPGMAEEVRRRGHATGNHTMHHTQGMKCSWLTYARHIAEADKLIGSRLFRPPHGLMKRGQLRAVKARYKVVMYDVVTRDYSAKLTADDVVANVRKYVRNGSVVVFHDSRKAAPRMLEALPRALEWLAGEGYAFGTLDDILRK